MTTSDSFEARWLALRATADTRARDAAGVDVQLQRHLQDRRDRHERPSESGSHDALDILDLGAGTGANLRRLSPLLGPRQHWTLVDHDARLLHSLEASLSDWAVQHDATVNQATTGKKMLGELRTGDNFDVLLIESPVFTLQVERLHRDLSTDLDTLPFTDAHLVTGSALLDLAGEDWLSSLARLCAEARCSILFALSYDGQVEWAPELPDDAAVQARVNRHQHTDKGLGLSLGPDAVSYFAHALSTRHGLTVSMPRSDWTLGAEDAELQGELAAGYARAATAIDPDFATTIEQWLSARLALIEAGHSALRVGHQEVFVAR